MGDANWRISQDMIDVSWFPEAYNSAVLNVSLIPYLSL